MNNPSPLSGPLATATRMGVFICRCGAQMEEALDTAELSRRVKDLPGVVYAAREAFPCSKGGQERIRQTVREKQLDRVLVAGCAPKLVGKLFRELACESGLDADQVAVVDIREPCASLAESDPARQVDYAARLISVELRRLERARPARLPAFPIQPAVLVAGGSLPGLTVALNLAESGREVILVEASGVIGQPAFADDLDDRLANLVDQALAHPRITLLKDARLSRVWGRPGDYQVQARQGTQVTEYRVGTLVLALEAWPQPLQTTHWLDRTRVRTQVEFARELLETALQPTRPAWRQLVFDVSIPGGTSEAGAIMACRRGLRQAARAAELLPEAQVTLLYTRLELGRRGGEGEAELLKAQARGVSLVCCLASRPAVIHEKTIDFVEAETGQARQLAYDRAVLATPLAPEPAAGQIASLLGIPQDAGGFLLDPRIRLRPDKMVDDGIFVLGSAHQPIDPSEALVQAFVVAGRVRRFLGSGEIAAAVQAAEVLPERCTGCGDCAQVCPAGAIHLQARPGVLSLSHVEPVRCTACGACVVACPVRAISLPGWEDDLLLAQVEAALQAPESPALRGPQVVVFGCEWSGSAAAELAGTRRLSHPANVSVIRLNCSARFDPYHALWALLNGADGVLLVACPPGECHYGHGNQLARQRMEALRKQMVDYGIDPRCVRVELIRGDDIEKYTQTVNEFMAALEKQAYEEATARVGAMGA